jgi:leucine-rich repeat/coiled-coil domain-containing protein 1
MKLQKRYDNQLLQLNNLQEQLEKANKSQTEVFREMNDSMRESEKKFANSQHELSFQQQLVRKLQLQIQELQALIAAREKERIKELEYIDRKNVDGIVEKEVAKERLRLEQVVMQYKEKLNQQHESYQYLEDEFRSALHIEATRYSQVSYICIIIILLIDCNMCLSLFFPSSSFTFLFIIIK